MDVFDADYIARASPFAAKDVTSRASQLGYHLKGAYNSKNPNEVKKKNVRRKKKICNITRDAEKDCFIKKKVKFKALDFLVANNCKKRRIAFV